MRDTLLGFVADSQVSTQFMMSVVRLQHGKSRVADVTCVTSGPSLYHSRGVLAKRFLDGPHRYLLSIDTDIEFEPQDVDRLYRHFTDTSIGIVSGVYVNHDGKPVYRREKDGLISGVGAGFMLVPRWVFERIPPETAYYHLVSPQGMLGEDLSFCARVREAGFKIVVDTDVRPRHYKTKALVWDGELRQEN